METCDLRPFREDRRMALTGGHDELGHVDVIETMKSNVLDILSGLRSHDDIPAVLEKIQSILKVPPMDEDEQPFSNECPGNHESHGFHDSRMLNKSYTKENAENAHRIGNIGHDKGDVTRQKDRSVVKGKPDGFHKHAGLGEVAQENSVFDKDEDVNGPSSNFGSGGTEGELHRV